MSCVVSTARAWVLKEVFRSGWCYHGAGWARRHFERWHSWAIRSRLEPVKRVARMWRKHLANVLTYYKTRLTNGPIEGLNNRLQASVRKSFG